MKPVVVSGSLDDLRSRDIRFLHEASNIGPVHVELWDDAAARAVQGEPPRFPLGERRYVAESIRFVSRVSVVSEAPDPDALPGRAAARGSVWAVPAAEDTPRKREFCRRNGMELLAVDAAALSGFPELPAARPVGEEDRRRVLVTGCYDWFHSGHVRFFEEASALGDLFVVVGHDANIRLLKGAGHPLFPQEERRYMVQSVRFVRRALISSGHGWLDAEPEIEAIRPRIYLVNEDGDKPEKREYCARAGIEYVVLSRAPKEGLPRRESTVLRGF